MVKAFTIELSQSSFVAGSTVCGLLVVNANEPRNYKKIAVYLKGHGKVSWSETTMEETYTLQESVVWENSHSSDGVLPTGRHTFPFQFTIPTNCPSSFRDSIGKIEYSIAGKISSKSSFQKDHVIRYLINVSGFVNTRCGIAQEPVLHAKEKRLGMSCSPQGRINYFVSLPRTLFCVGEDIQTEIRVENESGRRVRIKVSLIERINYIISHKQKHSKHVIMVQKSTSLQPHRTSYWDSENFLVPAIRPAIVGSNIIKSEYFLHIVVKIPWSFNSSMTIPVVIGNARRSCDPPISPYTATLDCNSPVSHHELVQNHPTIGNASYDSSEPPSYWDCVQNDERLSVS